MKYSLLAHFYALKIRNFFPERQFSPRLSTTHCQGMLRMAANDKPKPKSSRIVRSEIKFMAILDSIFKFILHRQTSFCEINVTSTVD